jgi:hypothetical protein
MLEKQAMTFVFISTTLFVLHKHTFAKKDREKETEAGY